MTLTCREAIQAARSDRTRPAHSAERSRPRSHARHARPGNRCAALSLVMITPIIAEVTLGTTPLAMAWLMLVYLQIYGAGVLLIRELVRRTGGGWGSVLLLGVAYGLVIEGIVLQSLTSRALDGAAGWVPRVLGVNTAYAELTLAYHAVFSVAIPIALVELLFARHGRAPYLGHAGMVRCGVVALLGVVLLRILIAPAADPGDVAPPAVLLLFATLAGLLVLFSLLVLPGLTSQRQPSLASPLSAAATAGTPRPVHTALFCGLTTLVFLSLLFPIGATHQAAAIDGSWVLAAMLAAATLVVTTGLAVLRWSAAPGWSDRHRLAILTGPLIAHTVFGAAAVPHPLIDIVALGLIVIIMAVALAALDHRLRVRCGLVTLRIPAPRTTAR